MNIDGAYRLLNVSKGCTDEDIHAAWRALVLKHHPDRHQQFGENELKKAQALTKTINRAYSCLRIHLSRVNIPSEFEGVGESPNSESLLRKARQSVTQTQAAIEHWHRQLNRSRACLADGQRLTTDAYTAHKEYLTLHAGLQAAVEKRDAQISMLLETTVLRRTRQILEVRRLKPKSRERAPVTVDRFLPTQPAQLMPLLSVIQTTGDQTMKSVEILMRRFEQLEVERAGLGKRIKGQARNLRQSIKPFIEAAQVGRARLDAAQVAARQCGGILEIERSEKTGNKTVLKSRLHQLNELFESLELLQFRQVEGDAAEAVYAQLLRRQSKIQLLSTQTFDETGNVSTQTRSLLKSIRSTHVSFPQIVLQDLQSRLSDLIATF
jgi:hypothetical protein